MFQFKTPQDYKSKHQFRSSNHSCLPGGQENFGPGRDRQRKCARASDRTKKHAVNSCTFFFLGFAARYGPRQHGAEKISTGRAAFFSYPPERPWAPGRQLWFQFLHENCFPDFLVQEMIFIIFVFCHI